MQKDNIVVSYTILSNDARRRAEDDEVWHCFEGLHQSDTVNEERTRTHIRVALRADAVATIRRDHDIYQRHSNGGKRRSPGHGLDESQ